MVFPKASFHYISRNPRKFNKKDLNTAVIRHFCDKCSTTIGTESPERPNSMIVKVGTLDAPSKFSPQAVIFTCNIQPFYNLSKGIPSFDKRPQKTNE